ncbi:MAG: hypothetical protein J6Q53_08855 [Oscillospiraceae bacterium]|nr:hypothetical protein [Oscillospiraceae bacterium]
MKKLLALLLCVAMVASILVGCSGGQQAATDTTGDTGDNAVQERPEDYVFTIGVLGNSKVGSYEVNSLTMWLEEQSGYQIEIVTYAGANQAVSEAENGVKMPDILAGIQMSRATISNLGEGKHFIDLAPYLNDQEKSSIYWGRLNQVDEDTLGFVKSTMYAEDGKSIYALPTMDYCAYDLIRHSAYINQEWLKKLNLPMPTNKDELYNVLKAFKNDDPNGNGEPDEIPLYGGATQYGDVISWIMGMFCYMDDARTWRVDSEGKLSGFYWDENYREGLIFLNKLVKEGLLSADVFNVKSANISSMVEPVGDLSKVGIWLGHPTLILYRDSKIVNLYTALPQWGYAVMDMPTMAGDFITKDCKYPDAAWEILMLMCSQEGAYRMRYGEKGVDWDDADPNTISFSGVPAEIKVMDQFVFGGYNSKTWNNVLPFLGLANENERTQYDPNSTEWNDLKLKMMAGVYQANWNRYEEQGGLPDGVVKPLIYTEAQETQIKKWQSDTTNWYTSSRRSFILGSGELNDPSDPAQWQKYIDGFKTTGYSEWLEVAQAAYDATYGKQ